MSKLFITILFSFFNLIQPCLAFQELKGGRDPSGEGSSQLSPPSESRSQSVQTEISQASSLKTSEGTEVVIPGLGKLGMLPKMDFGLELLYGPKDEKQPTQSIEDNNLNDNLRIRGSIKHNF